MIEPFGARTPAWLDSKVIAATGRLPDNWLGLRLAIGLRRIVTMRLADDNGLDVVRWGVRMRLHPRHNGCEKNALFTPQMYEPAERAELFTEIDKARAARRTFVFVDVGANVGLFSLMVASYAGANSKIIAIEPEPENLRRLRFNIAANPDIPIRVVPVALGETEGMVALNIDRRDRGGTRTRALADDGGAGKLDTECQALLVERRTLLEVVRQEGVSSIDALKIDVEGAEDETLVPFFRDAPAGLWPNLLIIEDARASWRSDLFSVLANCGYAIATRTKLNVVMRRSPT
jgi:FkbM family methyltransferase